MALGQATDIAPVQSVPLQLNACRSAVTDSKWFHDSVGYEVFVRSFQDSNGDGIGDLPGLIGRLDYLNDGQAGQGNDLEVDLLWLMPITDSPSYHGYDVRDYRNVLKAYGTLDDVDQLMTLAHARGMHVVLDLVLNHASAQHAFFIDSAKGNGHKDWFVWQPSDPGWVQPFGTAKDWHKNADARYFFGVFSASMPDWNIRTPAVVNELNDVGQFWLKHQVDGFRLDAVRYLVENGAGQLQQDQPETIAFWQQFVAGLQATRPTTLLVGEAWASNAIAAKYHASGSGLPMTFDFDSSAALIATVQSGDPTNLQNATCLQEGLFPGGAARGTFLTNHDMVRIGTQLAQTSGETTDLRLAAVLLMTLPGTPWIYYGEEIGMTNGHGTDDTDKRRPMQWDASTNSGFTSGTPWQPLNDDAATVHVAGELANAGSLLHLYQQLIQLRRNYKALRQGSTELITLPTGLWGFTRTIAGQRLACVFNLTDADLNWPDAPGGVDLLTQAPRKAGNLSVPKRSYSIQTVL